MAPARIEYPTEPTQPAWLIPLSDDELRTLGELCAIQGQIEWLMQLTVMVLRNVSLPKARKLLGSPNLSANASIWLAAVEKKAPPFIKQLAKAVVDEIGVIRQGRNDFVHAVFAFDEGGGSFSLQRHPGESGNNLQRSEKPAVAVHNLKSKPMANLKETRDKAAAISRFVDYVYQKTSGMPGVDSSPPS